MIFICYLWNNIRILGFFKISLYALKSYKPESQKLLDPGFRFGKILVLVKSKV